MWSLEEEELLATLQSQIGNKWTAIAASIGRSESDVKVRTEPQFRVVFYLMTLIPKQLNI